MSLALAEDTQLLTVSLDGTVEAATLIGESYQIEVKGINTGQSSDDVEPFIVQVNFIGCPEVDRTYCATCDKNMFEIEDTDNSDYIWSNTKGCTQCRYGWEQFLYESSDDIIRGCQLRTSWEYRDELILGQQCSWGAVLAPESLSNSTMTCKPCTELIEGCALCTSNT